MNTQAGYSSYLWAAVLIPPAARPPRHTRDIGPLVATQGPSPRLTAASWHGTLIHNGSRETMYCTSTARGQKLCYRSKRSGDGGKVRGREGGSQLHCCDHTSLARRRVSSSHITQEVSGSTRYVSSVFTLRIRGVGQWRFGAELVALLPRHRVA